MLGLLVACAWFLKVQPAVAAPPCNANSEYSKLVLAEHPVAYYPLSDSGPTALCDASATGNAGSFAPTGIAFQQPGPARDGSLAVTADGTVNPATSDAPYGIASPHDFTLEGWFKTSKKQDEVIVGIGQPSTRMMAGIGPWTTNAASTDAITWDMYNGAFSVDAGKLGIDVYDGNWHYVVGSYEAAGQLATLYLDGRLLASGQQPDNPAPSQIRIGWWVDTLNNQPFNGSLAEIAIMTSPSNGGITRGSRRR
jgi:hypothetical protein